MIYHLKIGDVIKKLDLLASDENHRARLVLEEQTYDVTYHYVSDHHMHLTANGRSENVFVARSDSGKHVFVRGRCYFVKNAGRSPSSFRRDRSSWRDTSAG